MVFRVKFFIDGRWAAQCCRVDCIAEVLLVRVVRSDAKCIWTDVKWSTFHPKVRFRVSKMALEMVGKSLWGKGCDCGTQGETANGDVLNRTREQNLFRISNFEILHALNNLMLS